MEHYCKRSNVAIIEKCIMSEAGLRHLFNDSINCQYSFHFFKNYASFRQALTQKPFFAVIYSLFGRREERRECLMGLHRLSHSHPKVQRIVLAEDDSEAQLVGLLSPSQLHGIWSKSSALPVLLQQMERLFEQKQEINEDVTNHWFISQTRMLSPTEREILSYMTRGYSLAEIASQLDRNVKTIRAHKFNAMNKLGVTSDLNLLHAADMLAWMPLSGQYPN